MHKILIALLVLAIILVLRSAIFWYKLTRLNILQKHYNDFLRGDHPQINEDKNELIELFKEANIKDNSVIHQEFLGFGRFANMQISAFDNCFNRREDLVSITLKNFEVARGAFRKKALESVNPFYWIEFTFKLPQYLLGYFGVLPQHILVKVLLIIYWLLAIFFGLQKFDLLPLLTK